MFHGKRNPHEVMASWGLFILFNVLLLIAFPNAVDFCLWQLLGEEADNQDNREAANHSDGTAVDGVDRITHEHVDYGEAHTPDEACPHSGCGDTSPIKTQKEGSEECTS